MVEFSPQPSGIIETADRPESMSRTMSVGDAMSKARVSFRIVIGKLGLYGRDRGAEYAAHILRDAGFEVLFTEIRPALEEIVIAAIQVDGAGGRWVAYFHGTSTFGMSSLVRQVSLLAVRTGRTDECKIELGAVPIAVDKRRMIR